MVYVLLLIVYYQNYHNFDGALSFELPSTLSNRQLFGENFRVLSFSGLLLFLGKVSEPLLWSQDSDLLLLEMTHSFIDQGTGWG